jgi:phosphohistidine phosphatase
MKTLLLVRHAIAVDPEGFPQPESSRPLTSKGRRRFRKVARAFARRFPALELVFTSPLVRAVQTAELIAAEVEVDEVAVLEELVPGIAASVIVAAAARRAPKADTVVLVGHEPQLSAVLAELAQLDAATAAQLDFQKGSIVRIDLGGPASAKTSAAATVRWWLDPRTGARVKGLPLREAEKPEEAAKAKPAGKKAAPKAAQ